MLPIIATASRQVLVTLAKKELKNAARRAAALTAKGKTNSAISKLQQVRAEVNAIGDLNKLPMKELRRLTNKAVNAATNPGTYAKGADQQIAKDLRKEQREARRKRNQELYSRVSLQGVRTMTDAELTETAKYLEARLRGVVSATRRTVGESEGTLRYQEYMDGTKKLKDMTRNEKANHVLNLSKIDNYKTIRPAGAKESNNQAISIFGEDWLNYSSEERGAIWNRIKEYQTIHSVTSEVAMNAIAIDLNAVGSVKPEFIRDSDGKITDVRLNFDRQNPMYAQEIKRAGTQRTIEQWRAEADAKRARGEGPKSPFKVNYLRKFIEKQNNK